MKGGSVLQISFVCGQLKLNLNWLKEKGCFSGSCDRDGQGLVVELAQEPKVSSGPFSLHLSLSVW